MAPKRTPGFDRNSTTFKDSAEIMGSGSHKPHHATPSLPSAPGHSAAPPMAGGGISSSPTASPLPSAPQAPVGPSMGAVAPGTPFHVACPNCGHTGPR